MIRSVRLFLRDRQGAAATEMALMVPLLVTLMFGGFEAGYYMWNEHRVVKAVRDGARFAGRMPMTAYNCSSGSVVSTATVPGSTTTVETAIKNITRTGTIGGNQKPVIDGWANGGVSLAITCGASTGGSTTQTGLFKNNDSTASSGQLNGATRVRVIADTAYRPLFATLGFSTINIGLQASAEAVVMGR